MSHHSDEPMSDELAKILGLGATGKYPSGKYCDHDEGEIKLAFAADIENQRVLVDFGKPVRSIGFTGEQAEGIADLLHAKALELRGIKS